MILLGINGSKYERNMAISLCKFKNPIVTLSRTILNISNAIINVISITLIIVKVRNNLKEMKDNTIFLKYENSFNKYLVWIILYLFTFLSIIIMITLEGFISFNTSFNTSLSTFYMVSLDS